MSGGENHEEITGMLPGAALDILEPDELRRVLDHVEGCPECRQVLAESRQAVAVMASQLPSRPMNPAQSARLRARLLSRARSDTQRAADSLVGRPDPPLVRAARWAGWAVAAGLAGVLLMHHGIHRPLNYGWVVAGVLALVLVAVAAYARIQSSRQSALLDRIAKLERQNDAARRRMTK